MCPNGMVLSGDLKSCSSMFIILYEACCIDLFPTILTLQHAQMILLYVIIQTASHLPGSVTM